MDKATQRRNIRTGILLALVAGLFFAAIFADKVMAGV
jgi:hypothetical protein